jgi:uncharacterized protein (TIGR01777 family)
MHLLVTGSSGLIGTALVDAATARGDTVTRLVRGASDRHQAPGRVTEVTWNPTAGTVDTGALAAAGPIDAVVNLAGAGIGDKRWTAARKTEIVESRTRATDLISRTSASAVGYYGDRGDEVLTEESPAGAGFLAGVCVAWEGATAPAVEAGIRTVVVRTGIVLSASGGALAKQLPLFRLGVGGKFGSGRQYWSWITLDDEVAAILHCVDDTSLSGPVNATAPHPATNAELTKALGAALHRPSFAAVPGPALKLALGPEMATEMVLAGQRVQPDRLLQSGFTFRHPDLEEAVRSVVGTP